MKKITLDNLQREQQLMESKFKTLGYQKKALQDKKLRIEEQILSIESKMKKLQFRNQEINTRVSITTGTQGR